MSFRKISLVLQQDETDCGAACIASVAKHFGKNVSVNRIRYLAGTDTKGTSGLGLVKGFEAIGFMCQGVFSSDKKIAEDMGSPFVAHVKKENLDHYVVVYGCKKGKVLVADPADGIKKIKIEEFNGIWTGVLFLVTPNEKFERTKESRSLFKRFLYLLKPHKRSIIECFIGGIVLSVLGAISAFYFRFLIDDVLYSRLESTLLICSVSYLIAIIFQQLVEFTRCQLLNYMGNKIDLALLCEYFKHILHLPMHFFTSRKTGEIISRIGDTQTIRHTISSTTLNVVIDSCMLLIGGFFLFAFGSKLLVVAIIPVLLSSILVWIFIKPFKRKIKELRFLEAERQSSFVETVNGIATIKALSSEKMAFERIEGKIVRFIKKNLSIGSMANVQGSLHQLISKCGTLALYWYGSYLIFDGQMTLGQLISFVTLSGYFLGPLSRLLTLQQTLQEALIASDRLGEVLDMEEEFENEKDFIKIENFSGNIKVKDLSFSYGTRGNTLENLNFEIKAGEKVAFVGASGSGKTTMTKLLMKFYKPDSGEILIDGNNLLDVDTESFRNQIGYVPQEVLLFSGTIRENIMWGSFGKSVNDMIKASVNARAIDFIKNLPDRYETLVGERGSTLSGGERQRLSLARVFLRDPNFLIFDEATASLDGVSEKAIMDTINDFCKEKTMIIVAHRLSTIKNCDKIFVFDSGKIVESGNHESLLKKGGKYKELWFSQNDEKNENSKKEKFLNVKKISCEKNDEKNLLEVKKLKNAKKIALPEKRHWKLISEAKKRSQERVI